MNEQFEFPRVKGLQMEQGYGKVIINVLFLCLMIKNNKILVRGWLDKRKKKTKERKIGTSYGGENTRVYTVPNKNVRTLVIIYAMSRIGNKGIF